MNTKLALGLLALTAVIGTGCDRQSATTPVAEAAPAFN